jgi:hypothetical protein
LAEKLGKALQKPVEEGGTPTHLQSFLRSHAIYRKSEADRKNSEKWV